MKPTVRDSLFALQLAFYLFLLACPISGQTLEQLLDDSNFPEVLETIERRLPQASDKERQRLLTLKAECLVAQRSEEAESVMETVDPRTASGRFFRVRAQWQIQHEEYALARKDFRQALQLDPEPPEEVKILLDWADMESLIPNSEEARSLLSRALEVLSRNNLSARVWNSYYSSRYFFLLKHGGERDAEDSLLIARAHLKSMNYLEGLAWTYTVEAETYQSEGLALEARQTWEAALQAAPDLAPTILIRWGFTNAYGRKNLQETRYYLEFLERRWPKELTAFERYHLRLVQGLLWSELREYDRALECYRLAEQQAGPTRRFTGRHLSISLAFHRFSPDRGSSDMEIALWSQLRAMDRLNLGTAEVADFMELKLSKLPEAEQAAWLYELGVRLLDTEPRRSDLLFRQALEKALPPFKRDFLDAVATAYLERGRPDAARPFLEALSRELELLEVEEAYKLLRSMSVEFVTQMPFQNLWFGPSEQVILAPHQALASGEIRRWGEPLQELQERELKNSETGPVQTRRAHLYRTRGEFYLLEGRLAEAGAAYEMGRSIVEEVGRPTRLFDRYAALVYQQMGLPEQALELARASRVSYHDAESVVSRLYSNAVEVSLLLQMGKADEALLLCDQSLLEAKDQGRRAFQFARVRALSKLGRLHQAREELMALELPNRRTEYEIAVQLEMADILWRLKEKGTTEALREAWSIASEIESPQLSSIALAWNEIQPEAIPLELASLVSRPVEDEDDVPMLPAEFLQQSDGWMTRYPEMATGVTLLPRAMVARAADLADDEALVQFYLGQRELLCMAATSKGFYTRHLEVESEILKNWIQDVDKDQHAARMLGSALLDPINSPCNGKTLILVTHGGLATLAWDRLELSGGALVEQYPWVIWAGESSGRTEVPQGPRLLALGGISGAGLAASLREVSALEESAENVLAILTGAEANLSNLRRYLPQADVLHFATHSSPDSILLSDGELSRKEIYELPLKQGALVFLSSCEGAKPGAQERAPISLASAFLAAGASHVIASLERVKDLEAEKFVRQFYEELARERSPAKALQRTKLRRRADSSTDWSKFVLLGS